MNAKVLTCSKIINEIEAIPNNALPNLLSIIYDFRRKLILRTIEKSFKKSMKQALDGKTENINQLLI